MMIKSAEEIIVYESPDGGKTVYSRKLGETDRTPVNPSKHENDRKRAEKWVKYQDIIRKAETDPALNDLLDKIETYYELKYG